MQKDKLTHDTPLSWLEVPAVLGEGTRDQVPGTTVRGPRLSATRAGDAEVPEAPAVADNPVADRRVRTTARPSTESERLMSSSSPFSPADRPASGSYRGRPAR